MKKTILLLLLPISFASLFATPINVSTTSPMENSEVKIIVTIEEEPYTVSIQYNDTDLSKSSGSNLRVYGEEYKLTKAATTQPFYVNLSSGISDKNYEFIIEIKSREFIGEDYRGNKIYTDIFPTIEAFNNYHYSFKKDIISKSVIMKYYQPEGESNAKHIGAFTFSWEENTGLPAGTYTSTNIINITSENAVKPQSN